MTDRAKTALGWAAAGMLFVLVIVLLFALIFVTAALLGPWMLFGWLGIFAGGCAECLKPDSEVSFSDVFMSLITPRYALLTSLKGPPFLAEAIVLLHFSLMHRYPVLDVMGLKDPAPLRLPAPDTKHNTDT